ncbi:alpha/beta hydrolase [Marinobacterium jannaschii]|uniref:alpha/beta hydrolase n=1 Tax=Marinobacterium jannaschii TaxID=64970 RepID=UPI000489DFEE|nr:alpha/beta fold hydrolase [Marinobacterium jannaschii]
MIDLLPAVEVEPASSADAAVIWLHGLGANGHDFEPVIPYLGLPPSLAVRFVFPHAPERPVTVNGGWVMPAWYDILEMNIERKIDLPSLQLSVSQVQRLIEREIERGIDPGRIVLAGFSQGGAVAYQAALSYPQRLAGVVALSTYIASPELLKSEYREQNKQLPVWVAHGTQDDVVPFSLGEQAVIQLEALGLNPGWNSYPLAHEVSQEEMVAMGQWLKQILMSED